MDYDIFAVAKLRFFAFVDGKKYQTIADFARETGLEKHGKLLTTAAGIFASSFKLPTAETKPFQMQPAENKPVLATDSPAVNAGEAVPTITDGYTGNAPDVGAYELDKPLPHYGPRPVKGLPENPKDN